MRTRVLFASLMLFSHFGLGQNNIKERVYVHLSSQNLIAGETLYYSAYCVSDLTSKPSGLSKILYLEIIGEDGSLHQEKLILKNGRAKGQFFISSLVNTGRYQVLAYTRWMRNFKEYFQAPLVIINPYEEQSETSTPTIGIPTIEFLIQNENLVINTQNIVSFKINQPGSQRLKYNGRLVNSKGELITRIEHDQFGFGSFGFIPKSENEYQVILEDTIGNFTFFDLPFKSTSGTSLNLNFLPTNEVLEVKVESTQKVDNIGTLLVKTTNRILWSKIISLNSTHLISLDSLNDEPVRVTVLDSMQNCLVEEVYYKLEPLIINKKKTSYTSRENVTINHGLPPGQYSISVRKKRMAEKEVHSHAILSKWKSYFSHQLVEPDMFLSNTDKDASMTYLMSSKFTERINRDSVSLLPEYRDEFFEGVIYDSTDSPISNSMVTLALPGNPFQLRTSKSSADGSFVIPFKSSIIDIEGYLSGVDLVSLFKVETKSPFLSDYPKFDYSLSTLSSEQINEIVARSIRNQIVNAYYEIEPVGFTMNNWLPQFAYTSTYNLDDFTRFKSIKETFTEYILSANVRENRTPKIKVYISDIFESEQNEPLLLLDGLPISADEILSIPAEYIAEINLLNNRVFLGPYSADGVIAFESKVNSLEDFDLTNKRNKVSIKKVSSLNNFRSPDYSLGLKPNLPDQRDQLYWNPEFEVGTLESGALSFSTSDVPGIFEIVMEGFTSDGLPVSKIIEFEVVESTEK